MSLWLYSALFVRIIVGFQLWSPFILIFLFPFPLALNIEILNWQGQAAIKKCVIFWKETGVQTNITWYWKEFFWAVWTRLIIYCQVIDSNFRLLWPCIMNIRWRERNQQDATNLMFIIKLLSQHVSGIIMPIIRLTRVCSAAYGVLHWLCWLWLCGAGTRAVCTVIINIRLVAYCWFFSLFTLHWLKFWVS